MITLQLSRQLDDHELSECIVLHHALDLYRHNLKQAESQGLCYPAYFKQAYQIVDNLRYELTDALLGINQPRADVSCELGGLVKINQWQGGLYQ